MHRKTSHLRLRFIGASLGALLIAGGGAAAQAQTTNPTPTSPDTTSTTSPVAPPTTVAPTVDELVVTAEKRAVNIQDVPASVTAIQGEKLNVLGLKSLQDYTRYVPGLVINNGGSPGQTSVTLRGIAAVGPGSLVGYYIDDTPLGSSNNYARATTFALDLLPYDLERLEVLRGPQGTLYGAGSMGGLLKYVLRQADPSKFDAKAGAETSYIDHSDGLGYAVRGAVNIPVIQDKLAVRLSAFDQQDQGYVDNVRLGLGDDNDVHQYGGRAAVTFKPIDNLRINLNALWYRLKSDDNNAVRLTNDISSQPDSHGADIFTALPGADPYGSSYGFRQPFQKDIDYYSGTVNYDLGPLTLVSATSYSKTKTRQIQDATDLYGVYAPYGGAAGAGVSYFQLGLDLKKFTQEVRLVSPTGGRVEWLVGGFYTNEKSTNRQLVVVQDANYQDLPDPAGYFHPFAAVRLPTTYKEYAAFGDLTFKITDKWDITGGLRYAHNQQAFHQFSQGLLVFGTSDIVDQDGASSESVATWQANTKYHITDRVMAYARVATGYRPGGPNVVLPNVPPTVKSDRLISYEGGFKTTWLDGRLLFNATAFDIQWKDIQQTGFDAAHGVSYLTNAGDAYSRGAELEGFFVPVERLRFGFNAAFTKGRVTKYSSDALDYIPGERLPGVPEWQTGTTLDYTWTTFNDWSASVGAGWSYRSNSLTTSPIYPADGTPQHLGVGYTQVTRNPAYSLFDAHAGLSNDRWAVNVFIKNITDHRAYLGAAPVTGAGQAYDAFLLQPRTVGISVDASF